MTMYRRTHKKEKKKKKKNLFGRERQVGHAHDHVSQDTFALDQVQIVEAWWDRVSWLPAVVFALCVCVCVCVFVAYVLSCIICVCVCV